MDLVVDLQGFTKPINEFVLKELAALEVNNSNNTPVIILFEPPCDWNILPAEYKVTNSWLQRNYLGVLEIPPTKPLVQSSVEFYNEQIPSMSKAWRKNLAVEFNRRDKGNRRFGQSRLSESKKSGKSIHKDGGCSHHRSSLLTPK